MAKTIFLLRDDWRARGERIERLEIRLVGLAGLLLLSLAVNVLLYAVGAP